MEVRTKDLLHLCNNIPRVISLKHTKITMHPISSLLGVLDILCRVDSFYKTWKKNCLRFIITALGPSTTRDSWFCQLFRVVPGQPSKRISQANKLVEVCSSGVKSHECGLRLVDFDPFVCFLSQGSLVVIVMTIDGIQIILTSEFACFWKTQKILP